MKNSPIPNVTSSLATWLYYIENLHTTPIDLGLERVRRVAIDLGLLQPAPRIIIVGGTNGKGTTCCLLENILLNNGIRVGVYSSPHLLHYTERVRIQGKELTESSHIEAMAFVEAGRGTTSLSYFEFSTLSAFQLFKQAVLEVVILEVGLGGRLDATNIIDADVSVITSIALDHTDRLGLERASIAREKAGIFRCGKPAVVGDCRRPMTIDAAVVECGAMLFARNRNWWFCYDEDNYWHWWTRDYALEMLQMPNVPLANAATALATVHCLPFAVSEKAIRQGLCDAMLPGRFQIVSQKPMVILDVAHNPHAASYLACRLRQLQITGKIRAVVGMQADKDILGTLTCLNTLVNVWYCAQLEGLRSASAAQLADYLNSNMQQQSAQRFNTVLSAWHQVMADARSEDCVLVFGSFGTVAPVMALMSKEE